MSFRRACVALSIAVATALAGAAPARAQTVAGRVLDMRTRLPAQRIEFAVGEVLTFRTDTMSVSLDDYLERAFNIEP